jgi:hypothetical protein
MLKEITPYRIANEVRMLRTRFKGSFLLVEGPTDAKVFFNLIDEHTCKLIIAYGKANASRAIALLDENSVDGVLAILDADFLIAEGNTQDQGNIILTDSHDLETMLLSSDAFSRVIADLLPAEQLEKTSHLVDQCRSSLLIIGLRIGLVRWLNEAEALNLSFQDLPYGRFVDPITEGVDISTLLNVLKTGRAGQLRLTEDEFLDKIRALESLEPDPWQVCQGHDLISLLELLLPIHIDRIAGREAARASRPKFRPEVMDRSLRLAFNLEDFYATNLYRLVQEWQSSKPTYTVFLSR